MHSRKCVDGLSRNSFKYELASLTSPAILVSRGQKQDEKELCQSYSYANSWISIVAFCHPVHDKDRRVQKPSSAVRDAYSLAGIKFITRFRDTLVKANVT